MRSPITSLIGCILCAACLFTTLVGCSSKADAQDRIMIYGGMGYLSEHAQPIFHALFRGRLPLGGKIRRDLEMSLRKTVSETPLAWSEAPIVFDHEDANQLMKSRRGASWNYLRPTIVDLLEEFDNVYVLSVVIDFELVLESPPHLPDGPHATLYAASATALLINPDGNEIVFAANHVSSYTGATDGGFPSRETKLTLLAEVYKIAAAHAVQKLARGMVNNEPNDTFDRFTVTGTIFPAPLVQNLFGLSPWRANDVRSICDLPRQCAPGNICQEMVGLVTSLAASSLSDAGKLVLPSEGSDLWARRSTDLVTLNLVQPENGLVGETLQLTAKPEDAEVKVIAETWLEEPSVVPTTKKTADQRVWSGARHDHAHVRLHLYNTDAFDCAASPRRIGVVQAQGVRQSHVVSGYEKLDLSVQRLFTLGSVIESRVQLTKEIRRHVPD